MKRKAYIWIMKILMLLSVAITCSLVIFVIGFVLYKGLKRYCGSMKPSTVAASGS